MNQPAVDRPNAFTEFEHVRACPGCESRAITPVMPPDIGQCNSCGLLFRNPRPTQAEIARSYDTGATFSAWQEEESPRAEMWDRRGAIIQRFQRQGDLLDIGTGDGRFLQSCEQLGYKVVGTEVSKAGAAYARQRGFDVRMGQFSDLEFPPESFDIVTMWHVLEHVPDPGAVLRKVHSVLKPGGLFAVAVPNEENYFVRCRLRLPIRLNPFGPLPFGGEIHLNYFRPATLQKTLRNAGFDVLEFGVDDIYCRRDTRMRLKLTAQRFTARIFDWHFAFAMYAICRKR